MAQSIGLNTLHHILKHYNEDVLNDCSQITFEFLNSLSDTITSQDLITITSIRAMLNLYETLNENGSETKIKFPVELLIGTIKKVLHHSDNGCGLDANTQLEILYVFRCLFRILSVKNSTEAVEELAKLYDYCLTCMDVATTDNGCTSDCLIFQLKMIQTVYDLLRDDTFKADTVFFYKKSRSINSIESKVFTRLVWLGDDNVAIQALTFTIPGYIDCFKSDKILEIIWKELSDSVTNSSVSYSRAMLILCSFFDKCFHILKMELHLTFLLEDANYWQLIYLVLLENDPTLRKQGMYLLKKTVEALQSNSEIITCFKDGLVFYWDLNLKGELHKLYSEVITVLEFLKEQQVHIIKPIFKLADRLLKDVIECDKMGPHWHLLIWKEALNHDSTKVMKWGLESLVQSEKIFSKGSHQFNKDIVKEALALLLPVLNSLTLYYDNGLAISQLLEHFFKRLAKLDIAQFFFSSFIKQVCSLVWSPEALFFVTNALSLFSSKINALPLWGEDEVFQIRTFVMKAFGTYHKIIAAAIQCALLRAIVKLMDVKNVSLKNALLLLSSFSLMESPQRRSIIWTEVIHWLRSSYSVKDVEEVLYLYESQKLGKEFNERSISVAFILLNCYSEWGESNLIASQFLQMLLYFKDFDRRPYSQGSLYDHYLSVISHICKASGDDSNDGMLIFGLPLLGGVISFIRWQLQQISGLQDFDRCQLYLNAFENITKARKCFVAGSKETSSLYAEVLSDLETYLHSERSRSSFGLYPRIRLFSLLLELHSPGVLPYFLASYLLAEVNWPLEKEEKHHELTRDIQTLWGRVNSEFVATKWKIFECFTNKGLIIKGAQDKKSAKTNDEVLKLCKKGLDTGGYGVLRPVMSVLKKILPDVNDSSEVQKTVALVWKLMMETNKTNEFKYFVKSFVEMLFQRKFIAGTKMLIEYADKIFSNPSLVMVNTLMRHVQQTDRTHYDEKVFCHIISKALIFGPVQRRDNKLTTTIFAYIEECRICPVWKKESPEEEEERVRPAPDMQGLTREMRMQKPADYLWGEKLSDYWTSNEVRARAVERVLALKDGSKKAECLAADLIHTLFVLEGTTCREGARYFGDSHVHRVKHRIMQALLLLEPLPKTMVRRSLSDWLFDRLLMDDSQPSVRYQQEWLLARISAEDLDILDKLYDYLRDFDKAKSRGLCSLMVVWFHMLRQSVISLTSDCLGVLVPLLMHQHFEVRLHAQMLVCRMYEIAPEQKYKPRIEEWRDLALALEDERLNIEDKLKDKYFLNFNPLKHYSLEVIYYEMPEVAKVASDEWISPKLFEYCGVDASKSFIPLRNSYGCLKKVERCIGENSESKGEVQEGKSLGNYQKKIIPANAREEGSGSRDFHQKRDGLVVVASLIDRVPNLGGLARTCEIFGVSEYVISSLRHMQDKQFTSLSVTAEKWIALKEVKPHNLELYILAMKENGYFVVGAEQTLHSQPLHSVDLPKKTLLLLGNEKEGIPPNLLPLLDVCVEIPQMGIIRSLNVHVTGALLIWEYAKQNSFSHSALEE